MNEQIRKLAVKSGIDIRGHLTGFLFVDEKPNVAELEKFAELIVKECISVMKSTVDESIDIDRKLGETYYWIKSDIKNHFGVEE